MKDYYYILGLSKDATQEDIKRSYRKISLKFHPDQNNGDLFFQDRFRDLKEAYDTLGNENRKSLYDNEFFKPKVSASKIVTEEIKVAPKVKPEATNSPVPKNEEEENDPYWYWGAVTLLTYIISASDLFYFHSLGETIDIIIWIGGTIFGWYCDRQQSKLKKMKKESVHK